MVNAQSDTNTFLAASMQGFADSLALHRSEIDRLNVFPVPDGDTGTNMALTLQSVVQHLAAADPGDLDSVTKAVSLGSLLGARGNSGVILSQLLKGLAESFGASEGFLTGQLIAEGLSKGSEYADAAVLRPKEGTILTVSRAAAAAAVQAAQARDEVSYVLETALIEARFALEATTSQLEQLAKAGVVDSGAAGFLFLLEAMLLEASGGPLADAYTDRPWLRRAAELGGPIVKAEADESGLHGEDDLRYEVMFLLEATQDTVEAMKEVWAGLGDSIVVVGVDGTYNCHIHTDEIGDSIEAGIEAGHVREIRVTDLREQVQEERWVIEAGPSSIEVDGNQNLLVNTGVVAVANGDGLKRIFRSMRVSQVVMGGQSMNPSTEEILEAINSCRSSSVIVLPNNSNIISSAQVAGELANRNVQVISTTNVLEGLTALMEYDPDADLDENVKSMSDVASRLRAGEVTTAVRDSDGPAGPILAGEWIGLSQSGIEVSGTDLARVVCDLIDRLMDDNREIVTLIEGDGSSPAVTRSIREWMTEGFPEVIVEVHSGGQPLYPYLVGVE